MANFNINIQDILPIYTNRIINTLESSCDILNNSYTVGLIDTAGTNDKFNFINSYSGTYNWKTLVITNINSTNANLNLKYNGSIKTNIDLPLNIDISSVVDGTSIPLMTVEENYKPINPIIESIQISFYIIDSKDIKGLTIYSSFQVTGTECIIPPQNEPTISNVSHTIITNESDAVSFTITGSPNTTYKYQILTLDGGNHGYGAELQNTDTLDLISPSVAPGTGNSVDGVYTTNGLGIINLKYTLEPLPTLHTSNENCVAVKLILYKTDGVTLNLSEYVTTNMCAPAY